MEGNGRSISKKEKFGLCDNPPPAKDSAYIDEIDEAKWIGIVDNPNVELVAFYGIDRCLVLKHVTGIGTQQECDGLLHYGKVLIFVELKDRNYSGWIKAGCNQLIATIDYFRKTTLLNQFTNVKAYVCNKQRPFFNANYNSHIQEFKDKTGLELKIQRTIRL